MKINKIIILCLFVLIVVSYGKTNIAFARIEIDDNSLESVDNYEKPAAPIVKVEKISNTKYHLTWNRQKNHYYQIEVKDAIYRDNNFYDVLHEYDKNIGSYTANVSNAYYDKIFRVRCYRIVDDVKVYSDYSEPAYASELKYPSIYISDFTLSMKSLDNAEGYVCFFVNENNPIKSITLTIAPYIRAGEINSEVQTKCSSIKMDFTGPYIQDRGYIGNWDPVWNKWSSDHAIILGAKIVYNDGTTEYLIINAVSH